MKFSHQVFATIFTIVLGFTISMDAQAKRLGGGKSFGKQSSAVTQKQQVAPSSAQTTPNSATSQPAAAAAKPSPSVTPQTQPRKFGWGGMLGGLAAGLGIGWLLSHFGLGEAAASFFMGVIIFLAIAMIAVWLMRKFASNSSSAYKLSPAGGPDIEQRNFAERSNINTTHSSTASAISPRDQWVDQDSFLENAKKIFVQLQEASDKQDLETLKEFTTPEMFSLLRADFLNRTQAITTTQVLTLQAELFHVEREGDLAVASIRFSGLVREEANSPGHPFEEVWNWIKPIEGSTGWLLAGIQQTQ